MKPNDGVCPAAQSLEPFVGRSPSRALSPKTVVLLALCSAIGALPVLANGASGAKGAGGANGPDTPSMAVAPVREPRTPKTFAGDQRTGPPDMTAQEPWPDLGGVPTSLAKLIEEVEHHNPQIAAAKHGWKAATLIPSQVSTLPDPQLTVQQFSVGSPRPFAGFTNSDFAYIGFGISQDLPYPGKLRLRGEMAGNDAVAEQNRYEGVRRSAIEQLKEAYFQLAYEHELLRILHQNDGLLGQIEKVAEARYRVGQGNQQDILKVQLQRTRLIAEIEMHHQEHGKLQAQLKQLANRPQNSPDIVPETLTETPLGTTFDQLLARVREQNPEIRGEEEMVKRQGLQVELGRKDRYPDFNLQYMWQHTGPQFRDYYVLSFNARVPIYRSRKQRPEVAQAVEELNRARRQYEAKVQQAYFEIRDQYLVVETSARLLKIYREGLIPQGTAAFRSAMAAYEQNRQDFLSLFTSFMDVLTLDEDYWRTLAQHETALARLEQLTGMKLQ